MLRAVCASILSWCSSHKFSSHNSRLLSQQTPQNFLAYVLVRGVTLWEEFHVDDATHIKKWASITFVFNLDCLAFFDLGEPLQALTLSFLIVLKDPCLIPVITLLSKSGSVLSRSMMCWHTYLR